MNENSKAMETEVMGIERKGFLDRKIDKEIDLKSEINRIRKEKNAVILAHYYQEAVIQDLADYVEIV